MTPSRVGPYLLIRELSRTGTASVHEARHVDLQRPVALKIRPIPDAATLARFRQESGCAQSVSHPNLVKLLDSGEADGCHYLAMELVSGRPLSELISRSPLSPGRVLEITREILAALEALHAVGVVHRDLNPRNVLIDDSGHVRVLDLGFARGSTSMDLTGDALVGTPRYLAPETIVVGESDPRSDLYQVGLIAYEAVSGRPAFDGDALSDLLERIASDPPPPLVLEGPEGERLAGFLSRTLAKLRDDRFPGATAARAFLSVGHKSAPVVPPSGSGRTAASASVPGRLALVATPALATAVVIGLIFRSVGGQAPPRASPVAPIPAPSSVAPPATPRDLVLALTHALAKVARPEFLDELGAESSHAARKPEASTRWSRLCEKLLADSDLPRLARACRTAPPAAGDPSITPGERAELVARIGDLLDLADALRARTGSAHGLPEAELAGLNAVSALPPNAFAWTTFLFTDRPPGQAESSFAVVRRPGPPALFARSGANVITMLGDHSRRYLREPALPGVPFVPSAVFLGYRLSGGGPGEKLCIRAEPAGAGKAQLEVAQIRAPGTGPVEGFVALDPRPLAGPSIRFAVSYSQRGVNLMPRGIIVERLTLHAAR